MDIASQAMLGGLLRVSVGVIAGVILYRVLSPPSDSRGAVVTGRRFLAWTSAISCVTHFGKWVFEPSADTFAAWFIMLLLFGCVAFVVGLLWGSAHKSSSTVGGGAAVPVSAPAVAPEARRILEVRLAKGEISIAEFKALTAALGVSDSSVPRLNQIRERSVPAPMHAPKTDRVPPPSKPPVRPEDFSDPATAEAVRRMLDALNQSK